MQGVIKTQSYGFASPHGTDFYCSDVDDYELEAGAYNVVPGSSDAEQILKILDWWEVGIRYRAFWTNCTHVDTGPI